MADGDDQGRWAGGIMLVLGALAIVQFFALVILTIVGSIFVHGFDDWPWGYPGTAHMEFFLFPFAAFGVVAVVSLVAAILLILGATRAFEDPGDVLAIVGALFGVVVFPPWGTIAAIVALVLLITAERAPAGPADGPRAASVSGGGGGGGSRGGSGSAGRPAGGAPSPPRTEQLQAGAASGTAATPRPKARTPTHPTGAPAREALDVGVLFQGRYEVKEHLGTGGMGRTFLAEDQVIGRKVVLKELLPHLRQDDKHLTAFLREARVAGGLDHPHIVNLYDVVRTDGDVVLVLEYVDGGSLADRRPKGGMAMDTVAPLLDQLLDALDALHDQGIWHRDVKPHNVLVTGDGRGKLADFGIAHVPGGETLVTGSQPGTVRTMAPEQITGGDVDGRADLYAVAALTYELLTGRSYLTFEGRTLYDAQRAVVEEPPELPVEDLDEDLNAFLEKGLAKAPSERFQTAKEMREALEGLV